MTRGILRSGGEARPPRSRPRALLPLTLVAGALIVVTAVLATAPAARDNTDRFLQLFRTQRQESSTVVALTFPSPSGLAVPLDDPIAVEIPHGVDVARPHDAQEKVDFNVRTLRRAQAPAIDVLLGQTATVRIDRPALDRLLGAALFPGLRLPAGADATVNVQIPAAVRQVWPDPTGDLTLWIGRTPRISTTDGPPWEELRSMLLQFSALTAPESARQLQSVQDWDAAVLVPVPPGATSRRVRADNVDGALLVEQEGRSFLVWQRFGAIHVLVAHMPGAALIALAGSLR